MLSLFPKVRELNEVSFDLNHPAAVSLYLKNSVGPEGAAPFTSMCTLAGVAEGQLLFHIPGSYPAYGADIVISVVRG